MKKIIKENIYSITLILSSPILYLMAKNGFRNVKDINIETEVLLLAVIAVMPFFSLIHIIERVEKYASKKIIKNLLVIIQFLLVVPLLFVLLNTLNTITDIFLVKILTTMCLSVSGILTLSLICLTIGILSIIVENKYEKSL